MLATFRLLILILLLFFAGTGTLFGQDFLLAKVVEVDYEKLVIRVLPQAVTSPEPSQEPEGQITVEMVAENAAVHRNGSVIPQCVYPGSLIRVWGSWGEKEKHYFLATDIRGCRGGGCSDPSGVRMRLQQQGLKSGQKMESRQDAM